MRFLPQTRLFLRNFTLMEYVYNVSNEIVELVGFNDQNEILIATYDTAEVKNSPKETKFTMDKSNSGHPVNIVGQDFFGTGIDFLITTTASKQFTSVVYDRNGKMKTKPLVSKTIPILLTHPGTLEPILAVDVNDKFDFYKIKDNSWIIEENLKLSNFPANLSSSHSSAFIDLTGDLRANLVLEVNDGSQNYVDIYDFNSESTKRIQKLLLADKQTGPIIFFPGKNPHVSDMAYVSKDGNNYFFNVFYNLNIPDYSLIKKSGIELFLNNIKPTAIYADKPDLRIPLNMINGDAPVLSSEDGVPYGLWVADLYSTGEMVIFMIVKDSRTNARKCRCLEFKEGKLFPSKYNDVIWSKYENVISVSAADIFGNGKLDIIINYQDNGSTMLVSESILIPDQNCNIKALSLIKEKNTMRIIPGATFLIIYNYGKEWRKVTQRSVTSFPAFQYPGAYVGLGPITLFLDFIILRTNSSDMGPDIYVTNDLISPNTFIVFYKNGASWVFQSFLPTYKIFRVVLWILGILLVNVLVFLFLKFKIRRRRRQAESKEAKFRQMLLTL